MNQHQALILEVKALRIVLKDLNKKGLTIILSSHVLTEVQEICSHVGIINKGKLIREESIDGIIKEIEKKSIRLLLKVKEFPEKISNNLLKRKKLKVLNKKITENMKSYFRIKRGKHSLGY